MILMSTLLLSAAACGGKSKPADPAVAEDGAGDEAAAGETHEPVTGTLVEIQAGDVSCYVTLDKEDGKQETFSGTFEVCPAPEEAHPLVGQKVTVTFERGNVLAASCEGNPDCPDSETVDLVNSITAAE